LKEWGEECVPDSSKPYNQIRPTLYCLVRMRSLASGSLEAATACEPHRPSPAQLP